MPETFYPSQSMGRWMNAIAQMEEIKNARLENERKNQMREILKNSVLPDTTEPATFETSMVPQVGEMGESYAPMPQTKEIPGKFTPGGFSYPNAIAALIQGGHGDTGISLQKQYDENEARKALYGIKGTTAQAGLLRATRGENETQLERAQRILNEYYLKKANGVPTTEFEDVQATTIYEGLTAPKVLPDGTIAQPKLSVGGSIPGIQPPAGSPAGRSPYDQTPFRTPRVEVTPGTKPREKLNEDVQDFSKRLEAAKMPQVMASVKELNKLLEKTPPDKAGVGYWKNMRVGNLFMGADEKIVKSRVQAVANDLLNMYSGLAVTLPEDVRRSLEMMKSAEFSAEDFYNAWPIVVKRVNELNSNVISGYGPEVVNEYGRRPRAMDLSEIEFKPIGLGKRPLTNVSLQNQTSGGFIYKGVKPR